MSSNHTQRGAHIEALKEFIRYAQSYGVGAARAAKLWVQHGRRAYDRVAVQS